jgi:hypothetical protein
MALVTIQLFQDLEHWVTDLQKIPRVEVGKGSLETEVWEEKDFFSLCIDVQEVKLLCHPGIKQNKFLYTVQNMYSMY